MWGFGTWQAYDPQTAAPDYPGSKLTPAQRIEYVNTKYEKQPMPMCMEHSGGKKYGFVPDAKQTHGHAYGGLVSGSSDMMTLFRLDGTYPQTKFILDMVEREKDLPAEKRTRVGLSPWGDLKNNTAVNRVVEKDYTHYATSLRPMYGNEGTWIHHWAKDTEKGRRGIAKVIQEEYIASARAVSPSLTRLLHDMSTDAMDFTATADPTPTNPDVSSSSPSPPSPSPAPAVADVSMAEVSSPPPASEPAATTEPTAPVSAPAPTAPTSALSTQVVPATPTAPPIHVHVHMGGGQGGTAATTQVAAAKSDAMDVDDVVAPVSEDSAPATAPSPLPPPTSASTSSLSDSLLTSQVLESQRQAEGAAAAATAQTTFRDGFTRLLETSSDGTVNLDNMNELQTMINDYENWQRTSNLALGDLDKEVVQLFANATSMLKKLDNDVVEKLEAVNPGLAQAFRKLGNQSAPHRNTMVAVASAFGRGAQSASLDQKKLDSQMLEQQRLAKDNERLQGELKRAREEIGKAQENDEATKQAKLDGALSGRIEEVPVRSNFQDGNEPPPSTFTRMTGYDAFETGHVTMGSDVATKAWVHNPFSQHQQKLKGHGALTHANGSYLMSQLQRSNKESRLPISGRGFDIVQASYPNAASS